MNLLLDTHTLLWFLRNSEELSTKAMNSIESADKVFVSIVSFWEIAVKQSLHKLDIDYSPEELKKLCFEQDIGILPVRIECISLIKELPFIHRDPFDRMIIAQAIENELTLITRDTIIPRYDVKTLW